MTDVPVTQVERVNPRDGSPCRYSKAGGGIHDNNVRCPVCNDWPRIASQTAAPTGDYGELIERLRAREPSGQFAIGGASISADGKCESWGGEPILRLRNPDGPAAADALSELLRELAAIPCQTRGAEDLEPGCCATCRARAALTPGALP